MSWLYLIPFILLVSLTSVFAEEYIIVYEDFDGRQSARIQGEDITHEFETIPAYANGVGPDRHLVVHEDGTVTDLVTHAHALGLEVHVWTLMGDKNSPDGLSPVDETRRLYDLGVDAVFADDPEQALAVRAAR